MRLSRCRIYVSKSYFIVTLHSLNPIGTHDTQNDKINDKINGKINGKINYDELSNVETSVLNAVMENNRLTIPLISAQTGLSQRSISRALELLRNKGIIKRIGPRKTGYWEIIEEGKED